jgi:phosphatidate cytidylyltransferase
MSTNSDKPRVSPLDQVKGAIKGFHDDMVATFSPKAPHSDKEHVAESKRPQPETAPVSVPALVSRNLVVRAMSGALYVAINVVGIVLGGFWCALVMAATAGICCWEFFRMMRSDTKLPNQIVGVVFAAIMPLVALVEPFMLEAAVFLLVLVLGFWYVIDQQARITDVAVTAFGSLYTGFTLSALVAIRCTQAMSNEAAIILCIGVMASVWINDAFAYLVGSAVGKHKMVPAISPKKSWEGFVGGLCGSLLVWCLLLLFPETGVTPFVAVVCGLVCGVVGVIGDLVESRIKRGAGVKDSGNLIPGHGGLLDRSDSMLFVAIAAFFILYVMGVI